MSTMKPRRGRPPKDRATTPQNDNPSDISLLLQADRKILEKEGGRTGNMYKALADEHKQEMLVADISFVSGFLGRQRALRNPYQVDLNNFEQVEERTISYFEACAEAKHFPSMMSLCVMGFGLDMTTVNTYIREHNNQTTQYLKQTNNLIADIMTNASMFGNADNTSVIFQLKNLHGFQDTVKIEAVSSDIDTQIDEKALFEEYAKYDPEFAKSLKDITPDEVANGE